MARRRTTCSRTIALATGAIVVMLADRVIRAESTAVLVLESVVLAAATAGATMTWLHHSFESRLAVGLAVGATCSGTLLSLTVGLPGQPVVEPTPSRLVLLALCVLVAGLLAADARSRRTRRSSTGSPYAL